MDHRPISTIHSAPDTHCLLQHLFISHLTRPSSMASDFSDPLTSAAYASSKTDSTVDPLTSPPPLASTPTTNAQRAQNSGNTNRTNANAGTRSNVSSIHGDPLSMLSSPAMREPLGSSLASSALTRQQKSVSPGLAKRTSNSNIMAPKTNRPTENLASSSLPSSPMSTPFADPLNDQSNGLDHTEDHDHDTVHSSTVFATPRPRAPVAKRNLHHTSSYYNQSTSNDNTNHRATIAAYPTSSSPVSTSHSPAPISNTRPSEHKVNSSPPRITRRDSQYEAQRVKAPQYLLITIPDKDRRAKDGMFVLSVQVKKSTV